MTIGHDPASSPPALASFGKIAGAKGAAWMAEPDCLGSDLCPSTNPALKHCFQPALSPPIYTMGARKVPAAEWQVGLNEMIL